MDRYLEKDIVRDLSRKMVFLGGPRQVGKTTMVKKILKYFPYKKGKSGLYFNWDFDEDKENIIKRRWDEDHELLVFDELHKYHRWKNWIKGVYDKQNHLHQFLVTGSARLDVYRRGGDSLMGRYHYFRLHPVTLDEMPAKMTLKEGMKRLMSVGGFPEPFLDGDEQNGNRWRKERFDRVIKEDIRELESVKLVSALSLFIYSLRKRVGQLVILSNMAGEVQISPKTAKLWLEIASRMYLCFSVWPYTKNLPRSLQKPPKVYFFDNGDVISDEGARFENLVATHLLKKIHYLQDTKGLSIELRYIRDKEFREVDFAILKNHKVFALLEVKLSQNNISKSLLYYSEKLRPFHSLQVVMNLKQEYKKGNCRVLKLKTAMKVLFS